MADASFWNGIDDESISMWVAAFNTSTDPDVYQNYYSEAILNIHRALL